MNGEKIRCPCRKCRNRVFKTTDEIMFDICMKGFIEGYYNWTAHGEVQVIEYYDDPSAPVSVETHVAPNVATHWGNVEQMNWDQRMVYDAAGRTFSRCIPTLNLWVPVVLFLLMVSQWASDLLPRDHTLPPDYYSTKKLIRDLGLPIEKIHACKNGCMLYWKDDIGLEYCKFCGDPRYKPTKDQNPQRKKSPYAIL
ncbi:UNVERIFIED_CONTAM: hypothetical protein Sradi_6907200, partial [Sesamum radiatum]